MRIIVSGGGTGGHIYPALALIKRLQQRRLIEEVLYVGTQTGLEQKIIKQEQIPFKALKLQGFQRKLSWHNVETVKLFVQSIHQAKKIITDFRPDVVVGTGGYVCSAIVTAAHFKKVPTLIHEQNSIAGLTNKFLGHFVDKIAYAFENVTTQFSEKNKLVFTGNPRAQEVNALKPNERLRDFGLDPQEKTIMIFGGSRGAKPINQAVIDSLPSFSQMNYQLLFVTGQAHFAAVQKQLTQPLSDRIKVVPYIDDMPSVLPDLTLIVGRSGATSIAELTSLGIPAIFIPSPYVTHDHQTKNAQALVDQKAALMIPETQLTAQTLVQTVSQVMGDSHLLQELSDNARQLGVDDASDRLIQVLLDLIQNNK
ncbi:undecaprenyldiphospho-muramoylpentapeptide beta-N-acetylglucosaminyltransferase [Bombilactobacillus folatiphilus]|uniref:UDP-N-acetylglucosamine--N-acetylmuramyl-(pentapeptide) pyrophosphoryl-undecaprenol N-acetylglucosamine transferase n=1 Tax=Bombilactobacillus folatiphilus TaxID=2923362 RepID=A0ABY4PAX0_9LACO|nr:undecaprenyldiphospho-muramoylpentapeptide beta-N-acetylglucosaminyltransferase [Bombilactobacillus folatiphilus]UQS82704.1 undecaprenyldiphospho-muramoylpentapeptide beta-N-acetylglucosaminyltransferase [Bombilactobacillus folatiphilus]